MGRKLDPNRQAKRGPGRKARKQRGAEEELARFLPPALDDNATKLSSHARRRAAKRRIKSEKPQMKKNVLNHQNVTAKKKTLKKANKGESSQEDNPTNCSSDAATQLTSPALRKKRPRTEESEEDKGESMAFSDEDDLSEDDIMDDYGVASSSDEELLPIEQAAQKQKMEGQDINEDDSEDETPVSKQRVEQEEEKDTDLQLNMEAQECFVLPSGQEIEKEDILTLVDPENIKGVVQSCPVSPSESFPTNLFAWHSFVIGRVSQPLKRTDFNSQNSPTWLDGKFRELNMCESCHG